MISRYTIGEFETPIVTDDSMKRQISEILHQKSSLNLIMKQLGEKLEQNNIELHDIKDMDDSDYVTKLAFDVDVNDDQLHLKKDQINRSVFYISPNITFGDLIYYIDSNMKEQINPTDIQKDTYYLTSGVNIDLPPTTEIENKYGRENLTLRNRGKKFYKDIPVFRGSVDLRYINPDTNKAESLTEE